MGSEMCIRDRVYGPGGYKFLDFMKVGLPLSLILLTLAVILIPIIWPFS